MIREQPDLARRVGQMSDEEFQATMTAVGKTGSALHAAMGQMSPASRALFRAMRYSGARVPGSPQVNNAGSTHFSKIEELGDSVVISLEIRGGAYLTPCCHDALMPSRLVALTPCCLDALSPRRLVALTP
jgi:hypothetical protein